MKAISVTFNTTKNETKVTFSQDFMNAGWVKQMDIMRDVIDTLTKHYSNMLSQENGTYIDEVKK